MFLFNKIKKKNSSTDVENATLTLRENIRVIQKREDHLLECIQKELILAKTSVEKDKRKATLSLRRKKQYEKEVERLSNTRFALEQQMLALESASLNVETFKSLKSGAQTLSILHKKVDANSIDDAMDSVREQLDIADEISEAISQPFTNIADQDLSEELEELQQEVLNDRLLQDEPSSISVTSKPIAQETLESEKSKISISSLPNAGTTPITSSSQAEKDEKAELDELRTSMAV